MKSILVCSLLLLMSCTNTVKSEKHTATQEQPVNLSAVLDTIWKKEQLPLRARDSLSKLYGFESELVQEQHEIAKQNHVINEQKVKAILDTYGWPTKEMAGDSGNWTICNVIQHSDNSVRLKYLPMMRQAVKDKKLEPRFLVRAEDRIATERGDLQIYGGQMKYYPETKSFNLWPVYDPENIDKRRTAIGLDSIAIFLKNRFNFEWNLEEQKQRTAEFERQRTKQNPTKKEPKLSDISKVISEHFGIENLDFETANPIITDDYYKLIDATSVQSFVHYPSYLAIQFNTTADADTGFEKLKTIAKAAQTNKEALFDHYGIFSKSGISFHKVDAWIIGRFLRCNMTPEDYAHDKKFANVLEQFGSDVDWIRSYCGWSKIELK